jgi:DNA repair protein RecN (Recombination protein N)
MLSHLVIRNFAIIEHLEIPFHDGYTVLTGETGAGKSIIIDALNLLLGGRASTDVIRSDEDEAVVEAIFAPKKDTLDEINARLEAEGIETGAELVVRRIVSRSGRNKVFVNGGLSTVSALGEVTHGLVDISGQHEHYSLFDIAEHVEMLDGFADVVGLRGQMDQTFALVADLRRKLSRIQNNVQERLNRIDFLRFQLEEIDHAELDADEDEELKAELQTLKHAEKIVDATKQAAYLCFEGNSAAGAQLAEAVDHLTKASQWDPQLAELAARIEEARIGVEDVARELASHNRDLDSDPARLDNIVERLELIKRLKRKHGAADVAMILGKAENMRTELHELENAEERGGEMEQQLEVARKEALAIGYKLSKKRRKAAEALEEHIERELCDLNMKHTRFVVNFEPAELPKADALEEAELRLGASGFDQIEFLIAPNAGEEPRPLAKIASGGELSRIMLAFKSVLVDRDSVETYVFDEVDTGIGGQTADIVGVKIKRTADSHQVLCITHLPQIASRSDHHYLVEKLLDDGRTRSRIRPLDEEERVEELARMLGGTRVTAKTRDAARELLD